MKTIGIIGGLGPESTAAYYTHITRKYYEIYGDYAYPEIIIHSFNFKEFIDASYYLPAKIRKTIEGLQKAGADFIIASCNSVHLVYEEVSQDISIPWLSIMDAAGEKIKEQGLNKVAILGTIFTMENDFYFKAFSRFGIETIVPNPSDMTTIDDIIYKELVKAEVKENSRMAVLNIIDELKQNGAQGVVLGCTELPFLIRQEDTMLPVFDTTELHSTKALEIAMGFSENTDI